MTRILHIIHAPDSPDWDLLKNASVNGMEHLILRTRAEDTPGTCDCPGVDMGDIPTADIHLIHAHSWMADGSTAWKIHQEQGIPYILSLSEEDIQYAHALSLRLHGDRLRILQDASKVIFPHPQFFHAFNQALSDSQADQLFGKSSIICRSIRPLFLQQLYLHKPVALVHIRLLYIVQHPDYESELSLILKAMKEILHQNLSVSLTVAASSLSAKEQDKIKRQGVQWGPYTTAEELLEIYREHHIVLMIGERLQSTCRFAEALSQGMPVIYSRHSCLDGLIDNQECRIEKDHTHTLAEKIIEISQRYATAIHHISELHPLLKFNGREITQEYHRLYAICHSLHNHDSRI